MALDPVPWAISGSQLDTFVMREFANVATQDTQGIHLPSDFKVTATGSPSSNVSVSLGGMTVRNVQAAAAGRGESYIGRAPSATLQAIAPTSGSGRSDMLMARVRDPDFTPWQAYTDPNQILFGPYFELFVYAGCSPTATKASQVVTYSAVELARIDIPSSTSNITNAMIHDLRSLARPRSGFARAVQAGPGSQDNLLVTDTSWRTFPTNSLAVTVPTWATDLVGLILLNQVQASGPGDFASRLNIGGLTGISTNFDYNGGLQTLVPGAVEGIPLMIAADVDVTTLQGQATTVYPQAQRTFTSNTGTIWFTNKQQVVFDLMFVERPK